MPETQEDMASRNTGNHLCADAGPCPHSLERVATAYYDGFCDGIMRQPWEAAADYAAVMGQAYAKTGERPKPFIPVVGPGPDSVTWLTRFRDFLRTKQCGPAPDMLRQPATLFDGGEAVGGER